MNQGLSPGDVPIILLFVFMIVGILLGGDDDLPGPRRSWAKRFAVSRSL